jgi:hypothetical protein
MRVAAAVAALALAATPLLAAAGGDASPYLGELPGRAGLPLCKQRAPIQRHFAHLGLVWRRPALRL